MAKVGVSQGNPLAALGNILRKGPGRGSGRDSKSPRRESPITKKSSFKGSKESLRDGAKDSPELSRHTSEPKSPKMFRFGIRRSSSRSKKGDRDDAASDTSSVNSLNMLSVKAEMMETECSGLTVSRSAVENGEKDDHLEKTKATTPTDTARSGNRNSTYFKPPEVEPLSDLFASGELDALLKVNNDSTHTESEETKMEVEVEKVEKVEKAECTEEHVSNGNGLKRTNLHSSFRMYENRYRAEILERKNDKSPLFASSAEKPSFDPEAVEMSSSNDQQVPTSTPKVANNLSKIILDADHDTKNESSVTTNRNVVEGQKMTAKDSNTEDKQKQDTENERGRRRLFDDELFQSDLSSRSQSRVKKTSSTAPGLDAYAKAHKSSPPVTAKVDSKKGEKKSEKLGGTLGDAEVSEQKSSKQSAETKKEKSPLVECKEENVDVQKSDSLHTDNSTTEKAEEAKQTQFSDGGDEMCLAEVPDRGQKETAPPSPTHSKGTDPHVVIEKTELEKESEKKEADKGAITKRTDPVKLDVEMARAVEDSKGNQAQKTEKSQSDTNTSPKLDKETLSERVASRIRKRREEREEQKSSRSKRSYDSRSRIEAGTVSSARSKFDTSSPSSSPRVSRARTSTDSSRLATERKVKISAEGTGSSPSSDVQKRKADRAKDKGTTTRVKAFTGDGEEDMPDWRKRILERRKKAAEASAKTSSVISQSERSTASPKLSRHHETDRVSAGAEKSPRRDLGSDVRRSPFPSSARKSTTRTASSKTKETVSKSNGATSKLEAKEETDSEMELKPSNPDEVSEKPDLTVVTQKESLAISESEFNSTNPEITSPNPEITSPKPEVTSPKPEITSPKPKIDFGGRVVKKSSSSEPVAEKRSSVEVEPHVKTTNDEGEDNKEKKAEEDEVFASDTKKRATSISKEVQSSLHSNLPSQVHSDSQGSTGSRHSSTSSEQEVGVPFRSRTISRSRSPTPTSQTLGPLKLPADPGIPEWKKRVLERKKNSDSSTKPEPTPQKSEPVIPPWKKELLAKKTKNGEEVICIYTPCMYNYVLWLCI